MLYITGSYSVFSQGQCSVKCPPAPAKYFCTTCCNERHLTSLPLCFAANLMVVHVQSSHTCSSLIFLQCLQIASGKQLLQGAIWGEATRLHCTFSLIVQVIKSSQAHQPNYLAGVYCLLDVVLQAWRSLEGGCTNTS